MYKRLALTGNHFRSAKINVLDYTTVVKEDICDTVSSESVFDLDSTHSLV
jgi:hypothetical protein